MADHLQQSLALNQWSENMKVKIKSDGQWRGLVDFD